MLFSYERVEVETRDVDKPVGAKFPSAKLNSWVCSIVSSFLRRRETEAGGGGGGAAEAAAHISGPGRISKRKARCALSKSQPNEASAAVATAAAIKASAGGSEEEPTRAFFLSDCSRGSCV